MASGGDSPRRIVVALVGDAHTGKSTLARSMTDGAASDALDVRRTRIELDALDVDVEVRDTAGLERHNDASLPRAHYRGAHALVVVYSCADARSERRARTEWPLVALRARTDDVDALVLVGTTTECDAAARRAPDVRPFDAHYVCSARDTDAARDVLDAAVRAALDARPRADALALPVAPTTTTTTSDRAATSFYTTPTTNGC